MLRSSLSSGDVTLASSTTMQLGSEMPIELTEFDHKQPIISLFILDTVADINSISSRMSFAQLFIIVRDHEVVDSHWNNIKQQWAGNSNILAIEQMKVHEIKSKPLKIKLYSSSQIKIRNKAVGV